MATKKKAYKWPSCVKHKVAEIVDVNFESLEIAVNDVGNLNIAGCVFEPENAREIGQLLIRFADTGNLK